MSIEDLVRSSMDQLARDLQPSTPAPAAVRARVNRASRIRTIGAIGLAAAIAGGVVFGLTELRDETKSTPPVTGEVDVGTPVWMADGVLHIGDQGFPQDKTIDTALVPVRGGAVYGARGGEIVYQPVDGAAQIVRTYREANPPSGPAPVGPAADPDSDLVAILRWSTDDGRYDLFYGDAARGQRIDLAVPLGDEDWDLPGDPNPFGDSLLAPIYWVGQADGHYTALIRNDQQLWRSVARPNGSGTGTPLGRAPLDATLDVVARAGADGRLTFTTLGGKALTSVESVEPDGGLSHDGVYFAGSSSDPEHSGAIAVVDTHTGETRYIDPPSGTEATLPRWSSEHTLMFRAADVASPPAGFVVACQADTLECANVARVDDIDTTVLPRL